MTRIGLLTTSFPRWDGDIAGHFVLGLARALAARGHELRVLAPEPAERGAAPAWPGVAVQHVPYLRPQAAQRTFYGAGVPDNLRRDPRAWLGLLPFSAALAWTARSALAGCGALVSHWALPCALAAGAVRGPRPHLAVLHSADLHLLSRLPGRARIADLIARGADRLWFVSEPQRERFMDLLPPGARACVRARTYVRPMGVDDLPPAPAARAALRRELGLDRFTLLTLARLVPVKGLDAALSQLAHRADLEWLIAGEGPEAARLARLAARGRLRVRLLGAVHGARKRALLDAADAFVLPSRVLASGRTEGAPTAVLEAMLAGLPVVASAVGGVPAIVRHEQTGLLFDLGAPPALERAIDALIDDPVRRRALAARALREASEQRWCAFAPEIEALLALGDPPAQGAVTSARGACRAAGATRTSARPRWN